MIAAARHQIADRLGQSDYQQRHQQQRQHAAEPDDRSPTPEVHDVRRQHAAKTRAQREPAEHRRDEHRAVPCRCVLGAQRDSHRHRATKSDAGHEAQRCQRHQRVGEHAAETGSAEEAHADEQDRLASVAIGERPEQQGPRHQAEQSRSEQRREIAWRKLPFGAQRRCDERNQGRVEAVDLHSRQLLLVDEGLNVDLALHVHGCLRAEGRRLGRCPCRIPIQRIAVPGSARAAERLSRPMRPGPNAAICSRPPAIARFLKKWMSWF